MTNLGPLMAGYALPLPAINDAFSKAVLQPRIGGRDMPAGLKPRDLDFLKDGGRLFTYPYALYSAAYGIAEAGKATSITMRDKTATTILGDSGGFSFISGAALIEDIGTMRLDVLNWMERYCDVGAILDVPTRCLADSARSGVETFDQCLRKTQDSIDFARTNRIPGSCLKLMKVIQGRNPVEARRWYEETRGVVLEGYAFAGDTRKNLSVVCELLVMMMRDGAIRPGSWFHVFGTNHPGVAIFLTAVQRCLRRHVDGDIRLSFDSSTSFCFTQKHGQIVRGLVSDRNIIQLDKCVVPDRGYEIDGRLPFPFSSPLADRCAIGHFLPQTLPGADRGRATDALGSQMLSNHSVYVEVMAILQANRLFDMEHGGEWRTKDKLSIPWDVHVGVDEITEIFELAAAGQHKRAIARAKRATPLRKFAGSATDKEDERS